MADNVEFRDQFTRAGEERADLFADQIIRIADDGSLDTTTRQDKNGNDYEQVNSDHINRSRLMVDARFRLMAILAPKKYSEKVINEISGPSGGPVQVEEVLPDLSDNEIARRMALVILGKSKSLVE